MKAIDNAIPLLNNGYQVIPVLSGGSGAPLVSDHLDPGTEFTEIEAKEWLDKYSGASVALVAGKANVYALDFDIDDEKLAGQLYRIIKKRWKTIPIRKCNEPRFAIIFKAGEDLRKYSSAHSKCFKTPDGLMNQIELTGNNIITLFGQHRKTGNKYRWNKYTPVEVRADELPELDLLDVKKIFKFYETRVPESHKMVTRSTFSKPKVDSSFENIRMSRRYSREEMIDILKHAK
jgi:hypothetical protein